MASVIPTVVTGVVGIVGIAVAWFTGKQAREHAEQVADKATHAALKLGLTSRRHEAYVRVLHIGFGVQQWVEWMGLHLGDPQRFERPTLNDELWAEANALASAFASKPVAGTFKTWRVSVMECRQASTACLLRYQTIAEHGHLKGKQPEDLYDRFKESAKAADDSYKRLADQINLELTSSD